MPVHAHQLINRVRSWPRTCVVTVAVVLIVLVAARIALPFVVRRMMNDRLGRIPGYTGQVDDVSIHLWRGAYSLHGFSIRRRDGRVEEPFFRARGIDIALAWREVWRGRLVSNLQVDEGQIHFVQGASEEESQTDLDRRWQEVIQDVIPIDITHLEITDGLLRYLDRTREPKVDLFITRMRVRATGLRNRAEEAGAGEFPARIVIEGDSLGEGRLQLVLNAEPLAAEPHFHLALKLDNVNLPALNESLRAYANVDVGRGNFRLVGEMAGRDGGFRGYVKPFFEDLDFSNIEDREKGIGARIWERLFAAFTWVVKDKSRDQLATRIPFEGKFGDAKVGLLATIANLFRHGFIRAFNPTVEGSVHADTILPSGKSADTPAGKEPARTRSRRKLKSRPSPEPPAMSKPPDRRSAPRHLPKPAEVLAAAVEQAGIFRRSGRILAKTIHAFAMHNIARLGAALAFYTTVAVAPLLVLTIAMAGTVFGKNDARQQVLGEIERLAGAQAGAAVAAVNSPEAAAAGVLATLLGVGTMIFGILGVFNQLQDALNAIWRVPPKPALGWWDFLKGRLFSLATVIMTGFLLLVSLVASAMLSWLGAQTATRFNLPVFGLELVNNAISFAVVTGLFALVFRLLPDTTVKMKHVWIGAGVTALLFTIGKTVLGYYLGRASLTSAYGAAGSLLVLLLWCYYAAQIVFFGAEFTRVTALSDGGRDFTPFQDPVEQGRPV